MRSGGGSTAIRLLLGSRLTRAGLGGQPGPWGPAAPVTRHTPSEGIIVHSIENEIDNSSYEYERTPGDEKRRKPSIPVTQVSAVLGFTVGRQTRHDPENEKRCTNQEERHSWGPFGSLGDSAS